MKEYLNLQDHLCFSIYACSRAISRMYRPLLNKLGITYPQYLVLLVLWEKGERSIKEIGERLDLDSGTLTPLLKRMEEKQLIQRTRLKTDERVVKISLAPKGEVLHEEAACIPSALVESSGMNIEEIVELNEKIKALTKRVLSAESHNYFTKQDDDSIIE
ncbi:MarR family winged helix-turn-helix transcriptional regulator [Sporolactobacillus laevolacticus]|uniref:MarR family transcriptional regulator n=1 Tax=Sporolactobacillus laevolacticus DSM 442 TaxID=1395513 RepID=V6J2A6_9BACL|nr:MarR family transcriptional regulator [Sporolactobacillus laevolacticus]EST13286.1 MarR family transcriptional regulator [Sporolactobacillus laevolacticus DSM 442]